MGVDLAWGEPNLLPFVTHYPSLPLTLRFVSVPRMLFGLKNAVAYAQVGTPAYLVGGMAPTWFGYASTWLLVRGRLVVGWRGCCWVRVSAGALCCVTLVYVALR